MTRPTLRDPLPSTVEPATIRSGRCRRSSVLCGGARQLVFHRADECCRCDDPGIGAEAEQPTAQRPVVGDVERDTEATVGQFVHLLGLVPHTPTDVGRDPRGKLDLADSPYEMAVSLT